MDRSIGSWFPFSKEFPQPKKASVSSSPRKEFNRQLRTMCGSGTFLQHVISERCEMPAFFVFLLFFLLLQRVMHGIDPTGSCSSLTVRLCDDQALAWPFWPPVCLGRNVIFKPQNDVLSQTFLYTWSFPKVSENDVLYRSLSRVSITSESEKNGRPNSVWSWPESLVNCKKYGLDRLGGFNLRSPFFTDMLYIISFDIHFNWGNN